MKQLFTAIILSVLSVSTLFSQVSFDPISSESVFFSTPVEDRSFHVLAREDGTQSSTRELFIGSGGFSIPAEDPAQESDFNWVVNQEESFSISYNPLGSGNLIFSVGSVTLFDQPTNLTARIFIGNDNSTGSSLRGLELTDLMVDGESVGDIVTSGPNDFSGIVVSGFNTQSWEVTGKIAFTGNALFHDSGMFIYGESIPEASTFALVLSTYLFVLARRRNLR